MARKQQKVETRLTAGGILARMAELVGQSVEAIGEAQVLHADGQHREAITRLMPVGEQLERALALHRAALILHGLR